MTTDFEQNPPPADLRQDAPAGRWAGIARPYSPDDVERLRGSVSIRHTLADRGARRMWRLLHDEPYVLALGSLTGARAVQLVRSGLAAICPCADAQPSGSVPEAVRRINRALQQADEVEHALGRVTRDWLVPIVARARAGFDGPLDAFETTRAMVEAGAAAVQLGDLLPGDTNRPNTAGKVLVSTGAFVGRLVAARLAADVAGVPTVLVAGTGGAGLLASDADPRDREFVVEGPRTAEGFFRLRTGAECATARALACAPYADVLCFEALELDLAEARRFAEGVRALYPNKRLAFSWPLRAGRGPVEEAETERLGRELAAMGYRLLLVTTPDAGRTGEVPGDAESGREAGAYVELVAQVVSGGSTIRQAAQELREEHRQLHERIDRLARAADLAQMSACLDALHGQLTAHFDAEEKPGGLYDALGVCASRFRVSLGHLVDEHFRLAVALRDLRQRAHTAGGTESDALRADVARFTEVLGRHEQSELELVRLACEPGGGGPAVSGRTPA